MTENIISKQIIPLVVVVVGTILIELVFVNILIELVVLVISAEFVVVIELVVLPFLMKINVNIIVILIKMIRIKTIIKINLLIPYDRHLQ
jgi:hypothetical protein